MEIIQATQRHQRQAAYALRHAVFVEEQNVPVELEIDEHDETDALHFIALEQGQVVGTARILRKGSIAKIQRVAIAKENRGIGLGHQLMGHLMDYAKTMDRITSIVLDAQTDALPFYEKLGFVSEGDVFDDAGIPHRTMRYVLES
ncbi:MAG: GNAT family N-acetyltransferase [Pseudomonadota bacterium]